MAHLGKLLRLWKYWPLVLILAAFFVSVEAWRAYSTTVPIELNKEEALRAMNLHYAALAAAADRNEYVGQLYAKYGLDQKAFNLNIGKGRFEPVLAEAEGKKDAPK